MRLRIPRQLALAVEASQQRALKPPRPLVHPPALPVELYTRTVRTVLTGGTGAAVVAGDGTATVTLGPQGVGTVWYPQSAAIATTSGANDTSTCAFFIGPLALLTQIGSQSYAGGGDNVGLAVPAVSPGYFVVARWSGAKAGDQATLTIYGQQDQLVIP